MKEGLTGISRYWRPAVLAAAVIATGACSGGDSDPAAGTTATPVETSLPDTTETSVPTTADTTEPARVDINISPQTMLPFFCKREGIDQTSCVQGDANVSSAQVRKNETTGMEEQFQTAKFSAGYRRHGQACMASAYVEVTLTNYDPATGIADVEISEPYDYVENCDN